MNDIHLNIDSDLSYFKENEITINFWDDFPSDYSKKFQETFAIVEEPELENEDNYKILNELLFTCIEKEIGFFRNLKNHFFIKKSENTRNYKICIINVTHHELENTLEELKLYRWFVNGRKLKIISES